MVGRLAVSLSSKLSSSLRRDWGPLLGISMLKTDTGKKEHRPINDNVDISHDFEDAHFLKAINTNKPTKMDANNKYNGVKIASYPCHARLASLGNR